MLYALSCLGLSKVKWGNAYGKCAFGVMDCRQSGATWMRACTLAFVDMMGNVCMENDMERNDRWVAAAIALSLPWASNCAVSCGCRRGALVAKRTLQVLQQLQHGGLG
eukprot:TRINITY_DN15486_c0_g1_i1.p3 TRINITY_DN15486_c0_g1~~TRINITY_DN15486_c0_g1_i1.p3  ORF type:complete len:108 (-),score=3.25 TRINITY_DN15486_c0_g1_i1:62-385(-)